MTKAVTVGQIAKTLRCHERSARLYLSEVNAKVDRYREDLGERIEITTVLALYQRYQDTVLGRRLVSLLQTTSI
jgi:hypothetical protein